MPDEPIHLVLCREDAEVLQTALIRERRLYGKTDARYALCQGMIEALAVMLKQRPEKAAGPVDAGNGY